MYRSKKGMDRLGRPQACLTCPFPDCVCGGKVLAAETRNLARAHKGDGTSQNGHERIKNRGYYKTGRAKTGWKEGGWPVW